MDFILCEKVAFGKKTHFFFLESNHIWFKKVLCTEFNGQQISGGNCGVLNSSKKNQRNIFLPRFFCPLKTAGRKKMPSVGEFASFLLEDSELAT